MAYQDVSTEELQELEYERQELLESFKQHLALFCQYLNVDLDQQAYVNSISWHTQVYLSSPRYVPEKNKGIPISVQGYLSSKMCEEIKSSASIIVNDLASKIADSSQKLLVNDIALRGSPESIAEKLTLRYLFGHKRFYDIDPIPDVPSAHRYEIDAFSEERLLDRVMEHYTSRYHRYKLWEGRVIALFSSCLFDTKSELHPFFNSPNLIHLLGDDPKPIAKEWFKDECIECWLALHADPPLHAYTERAYPDDSGVIFEEYVPLTMVSEEIWDALYERYKNKLEKHIMHSV